MLTLTLVRHAKASRGDSGVKDFDRPLNGCGREQTAQMAAVLVEQDVTPDLILCSTARRTRQTLNRLLDVWPSKAEVLLEGKLYLAAAEDLRTVISRSAGSHRHVMLIGHNPGLHQLAFSLCERGDPTMIRELAEKFPTLAICSIRFDGDDWKKLANGELIFYTTPRRAGSDTGFVT